MKFNESSLSDRFLSWSEFTKEVESFKDSLLRSYSVQLNDDAYTLLPVSKFDLSSKEKIDLFVAWREKNQFAYPSRFEVTPEGTRAWVDRLVVNNPHRVLFWVADSSMTPLGHLGIILTPDSELEIDNVVKGVNGHQGLFTSAMLVLEKIALQELGSNSISLRVLHSNNHAVNFYTKLGYVIEQKVPMKWSESSGRSDLVFSESAEDYLLTMRKFLVNEDKIPELILTAGPSISNREIVYVNDAVSNGWNNHHSDYINRFEIEFAQKLGVKHAMATSSCTGALHISLLALGIGPGDEVIVPDITWVATAAAVAYVGATPIFVDVDSNSWNISVREIELSITPKTKAIIAVHLYGFPAAMERISELAVKHNLRVIEDAAPAIGAQVGDKFAGTFGDFGCFSFQGAKLLVTGEGGMLVTNNTELYEKAWKIQDHGRKPGTFWIEELGHKYKMNNVTAALGLAQIQRADVQIERKREINRIYRSEINSLGDIKFQEELPNTRAICWMTSITLGQDILGSASGLAMFLKSRGIDTRPVFPTIHAYPMWKSDVVNSNAATISQRSLNLPSGVRLPDAAIKKVAHEINFWIKENAC